MEPLVAPTPPIISLDTESYGSCFRDHRGEPLPEQNHFHPIRCLYQDGVPLDRLALTAAITIPTEDPRCDASSLLTTPIVEHTSMSTRSSRSKNATTTECDPESSPKMTPLLTTVAPPTSWSLRSIASLTPGSTMFLRLWEEHDRRLLLKWIHHADTLIGVNLLFDIPILRALGEDFRYALDGRHTVLDFTYIRYLESELSTAKGLKTYGPLHGLYVYDEETDLRKGDRYPSPLDPKFVGYQASDPHNSITAVAHAASLIIKRRITCSPLSSLRSSSTASLGASATPSPRTTTKLSPACVEHYSGLQWDCVRLVESGIPVHLPTLRALETSSLEKAERLRQECKAAGLLLTERKNTSKKNPCIGSQASKLEWIRKALDAADTPAGRRLLWDWDAERGVGDPPSIYAHKLIKYTDAKGELSSAEENRALAEVLLKATDPTNPILSILSSWGRSASAEKLASTYTFPLLRHRRTDPDHQKARHIPCSFASTSTSPPPPSSAAATKCAPVAAPAPSTPSCEMTASTPTCGSSTLPTPSEPPAPTTTPSSSSEPAPTSSSPSSPISGVSASPTSRAIAFALSGGMPLRDLDTDVGVCFPSIYPVPSLMKDGQGDGGGQLQSRLSFKNPSAQTFPPHLKACICSRFRGGTVWVFDLSQIELRVAGILSGEHSILTNYHMGLDLHTDRCIDLFGEPALVKKFGDKWRKHPDFKDNERQWGKKFNFEDLYLAGPAKMQAIFIAETRQFLPLSFFQNVIASRQRLRPILVKWQAALVAQVERDGGLELPFFGQSRSFLHGARGNAIGEIVNFPIQATAANVMHRITRRIFQLLPRLSLRRQPLLPFLNIYDSLFIDSHPSVAASVPAIIEEAFEFVRTQDYWMWVQEHYGNQCPLVYELKKLDPPHLLPDKEAA